MAEMVLSKIRNKYEGDSVQGEFGGNPKFREVAVSFGIYAKRSLPTLRRLDPCCLLRRRARRTNLDLPALLGRCIVCILRAFTPSGVFGVSEVFLL